MLSLVFASPTEIDRFGEIGAIAYAKMFAVEAAAFLLSAALHISLRIGS